MPTDTDFKNVSKQSSFKCFCPLLIPKRCTGNEVVKLYPNATELTVDFRLKHLAEICKFGLDFKYDQVCPHKISLLSQKYVLTINVLQCCVKES